MSKMISRTTGLLVAALCISVYTLVGIGLSVSAQTEIQPRVQEGSRTSFPSFGVVTIVDTQKENELKELQKKIETVKEVIERKQKEEKEKGKQTEKEKKSEHEDKKLKDSSREESRYGRDETQPQDAFTLLGKNRYYHPETREQITKEELRAYLQRKIAETRASIQMKLAEQRKHSGYERKMLYDSRGHLSNRERDEILLEIQKQIREVQAQIALLVQQKEKEDSDVSMEKQAGIVVIENNEKKDIMKEPTTPNPIVTLEPEETLLVEQVERLGGITHSSFLVSLFVLALLIVVFGIPFFMRWRESKKKEKDEVHGENPWNKS